jgi:hypothetical protein
MPESVTPETVVTSTSTETPPLSQREAAYQRLYASEHPETVAEPTPPAPIETAPPEPTPSPDISALIREAWRKSPLSKLDPNLPNPPQPPKKPGSIISKKGILRILKNPSSTPFNPLFLSAW